MGYPRLTVTPTAFSPLQEMIECKGYGHEYRDNLEFAFISLKQKSKSFKYLGA